MNARIDRRVLGIHLDMKTVIGWRGHDLARVGHGTEQTDIREPVLRRFSRNPLDPLLYLIELHVHRTAPGRRPAQLRQDSDGRRDVTHDVSFNQSKPVVVEAAQAHCHSPTSSLRRDRKRSNRLWTLVDEAWDSIAATQSSLWPPSQQ